MTSAELYLIFQQSGLIDSAAKGRVLVDALMSGQFPKEEIATFVAGDAGSGDPLARMLEAQRLGDSAANELVDRLVEQDTPSAADGSDTLPTVSVPAALDAFSAAIAHASDVEAVEFLVASAKEKLWRQVFVDEAAAVAALRASVGSVYVDRVKAEFLREYEDACDLELPKGYAFKVGGSVQPPNLMQRLIAARLRSDKRLGNWSGTGAGKTLSAILASRVVDAGVTVIC
jgi:hypothetical protein